MLAGLVGGPTAPEGPRTLTSAGMTSSTSDRGRDPDVPKGATGTLTEIEAHVYLQRGRGHPALWLRRFAGPQDPFAAASASLRPLEVVVSAYPLAVLVGYLGGKAVKVVDLSGAGATPQDLVLAPAQRRLISSAALVIDVGGGYQPRVEAAPGSARRHLSLLPAVSSVGTALRVLARPGLDGQGRHPRRRRPDAVDPGAKRQFDDASQDFQSVIGSIESDLESTFPGCSRQVFVTADGAFGRFAASFGLTDVAVAPRDARRAAALVDRRTRCLPFSAKRASRPGPWTRSHGWPVSA